MLQWTTPRETRGRNKWPPCLRGTQEKFVHSILSNHIQRTPHADTRLLHDVGVDHRRRDILVPEELLHRPDIIASLEQVGCKGMTKSMAAHGLAETSQPASLANRLLQAILMHVMAAH